MTNNFLKNILIFSFILTIIIVGLFFFFYREIKNLDLVYQSKENEWYNENLKREETKTLDRSIKIIEKERIELEKHFAKSSDVVPFLDSLEILASRINAKAEVKSVDILKDNTGLMVSMEAFGTFGNLYKFLTLLENSQYELDILVFDMHKIKNGEWNVFLKIKLLSFIP